ncbi:MAG: hypothetical protein PHN85_02995 [Kiritimatiellae bacterium]|nr:hypothetical protein [Kiritimatiellia bacterium]
MKKTGPDKLATVLLTFLAGTQMAMAEGRWFAPAAGWEHEYVASEGEGAGSGIPQQFDAGWGFSQYQTADPEGDSYVVIAQDPVEGSVLKLRHINDSAAHYKMEVPPGSGTTQDLVTLDFRFRLADDTQADSQRQLQINVSRPRLDGAPEGWNQWSFGFSRTQIVPSSGSTIAVELSNGWHTVRLLADFANDTARLYLDGIVDAVYTGPSSDYATWTRNWMAFGDFGGVVNGEAHVRYFRWTTNELVYPGLPEDFCKHFESEDPLEEGFAGYPKDLEYDASANLLPEATSSDWTLSSDTTRWLVTDEISGETALHLAMTNDLPVYTHAGSPVLFTANDTITCDIRFRLLDDTQADSQQQMQLTLKGLHPDGAYDYQNFNLRFTKDRVNYMDNSKTFQSALTPLGTAWHDLRWRINFQSREAEAFLDGSSMPLFTHKSNQYTGVLPHNIQLGSGNGKILGVARVQRMRVTRQTLSWTSGSETDGTGYWQGTDAAGGCGFYERRMPSESLSNPRGWTATCRVRVVESSGHSNCVMMRFGDGENLWSLSFDVNRWHFMGADGNFAPLGAEYRAGAYQIFQMHYDPEGDNGNGVARCYRNGYLARELTRAEVKALTTTDSFIQWGADSIPEATSVQRWNLVAFDLGNHVIDPVPPKGTTILMQ